MKKLLSLLALSLFTLAPAAHAQLYFSQDGNANGLFVLNTATGLASPAGAGITGVNGATVGLSISGTPGVLYGGAPFGLLRINTDGSGSTMVGTQGLEGLGYDAANNILYGQLNGSFFIVNQATGEIATNLASAPADVDGLDFGNGLVYGLSDQDDSLYAYNPVTNTWALIGATGVNWNDPGLAYDPFLNILYAIGDVNSTDLYALNPLTGAATSIGRTGLNVDGGGLAFLGGPGAVPEPGATALFGSLLLPAVLLLRRRR